MPDGGAALEDLVLSAQVEERPLTIPITEVVDWKSVLDLFGHPTKSGPLYIVTFRSIRSKDADDERLYAADALAHEEARRSGGLLRYWYANLNERRECFAMCIWESLEHARAADRLPAHAVAKGLARQMYDAYALQRYWLRGDEYSNPVLEPLPPVSNPSPSISKNSI